MVLVNNNNTEQQTLQQHFSKLHCILNHRNVYEQLIPVKMILNKIGIHIALGTALVEGCGFSFHSIIKLRFVCFNNPES